MNHPCSLRALALVALLMPSAALRASPIVWSYDWSFSTHQVNSDGGASRGHIVLKPSSGNHLVGSSDIIAVNLRTFSTASPSDPSHFTNRPFSLDLVVRDDASGKFHDFHFTGEFEGTLSRTSADLHIKWTSPRTRSFDLNHRIFTVKIDSFVAPGAPDSGGIGAIGAHVSVHHNPEPGSLVLAGLGLSLLGLRSRRWWAPC
jgi:hypothetical protein